MNFPIVIVECKRKFRNEYLGLLAGAGAAFCLGWFISSAQSNKCLFLSVVLLPIGLYRGVQWLKPQRALLTLEQEGVRYHGWKEQFLPWKDIAYVVAQESDVPAYQNVSIQPHDANIKPIVVCERNLDGSANELVTLIQEVQRERAAVR